VGGRQPAEFEGKLLCMPPRMRGGQLGCAVLQPHCGRLLVERPPAAIPPFALFPGLLAARCSLLNDW
jgi:hypothetical protein